MDEYDDLDQYNGDPAHDMNVDFDCYNNTAELADIYQISVIFAKLPILLEEGKI